MFGDKKSIKDSERSLISETVSIDGTVNSSGAIDVAGLVKGDIEFSSNLRTENGADIEGYIKKTASKSKITGDFLFSKTKEEKKTKKNGKPEANVNKEGEALV